MEWDDLLKRMYTGNLNHNEVNTILYCITNQAEANRKELEELNKRVEMLDRRTVGMAKLGPR
jgi:hypothetical protein